jgi:hypothetical protein
MPRKPSSTPRKRTTSGGASRRTAPSKPVVFEDTPRMISDDEKHQLIRAHAAMRAPQDPLQRLSLWAGVSLSVLMIGVGWWLSVGQQVRGAVNQQSEQIRKATAELDSFVNLVHTSKVTNPTANPTAQAEAASFQELLKNDLFEHTTRTDLMAPLPEDTTSTTSTAVFTPPPSKTRPSAPTIPPGLTPDP